MTHTLHSQTDKDCETRAPRWLTDWVTEWVTLTVYVTQSRYHVTQRRRLLTYINRRHYFHILTHSRLDTLQHTQTTFTLSCVVTQSSTHSTSHSHTHTHTVFTHCSHSHCVSHYTQPTRWSSFDLCTKFTCVCLSLCLSVCLSLSLSLSVCVCHKTLPLTSRRLLHKRSIVSHQCPSVSCPVSSQSVTVTQQTDPVHWNVQFSYRHIHWPSKAGHSGQLYGTGVDWCLATQT